MSNLNNEAILESIYEDFLEIGYTEEEAERLAWAKFLEME